MDRYKPITIVFTNINTSDHLTKLHMSLYLLLNSDLNKSDRLKIYINTTDNVLIDINSHIELPLNINEFTDMINYLLIKLKIKDNKGNILMLAVKNKLNDYLPPNTYKMKMDLRGKKLENLNPENTYTIYIGESGEDCDSVRVSDYDLNLVGK
ncbi:hypothetical protein P3W45_000842 [Vairimorpha bombi]